VIAAGRRALLALASLTIGHRAAAAQDSSVAPHQFAIDTARLRAFQRSYDMIVHVADSSVLIGARDVALATSIYAGNPAWLITETRSGVVPSAESLFVTGDLRPLHWSAAQGPARLAAEFVGDSIYGAVSSPMMRQNLVTGSRRDLVVNSAYADVLLAVLPLSAGWNDSATVMQLDAGTHQLVRADVAVIGEEELSGDSTTARPVWVVALRSDSSHVLYWIDKSDGSIMRVLQQLPAHVGTDVEFRLRPASSAVPPTW
jgi:hypothetical protein